MFFSYMRRFKICQMYVQQYERGTECKVDQSKSQGYFLRAQDAMLLI